jgi:hypothetical protein
MRVECANACTLVNPECTGPILAGLGLGTLHSLWPLRLARTCGSDRMAAARLLALGGARMHC